MGLQDFHELRSATSRGKWPTTTSRGARPKKERWREGMNLILSLGFMNYVLKSMKVLIWMRPQKTSEYSLQIVNEFVEKTMVCWSRYGIATSWPLLFADRIQHTGLYIDGTSFCYPLISSSTELIISNFILHIFCLNHFHVEDMCMVMSYGFVTVHRNDIGLKCHSLNHTVYITFRRTVVNLSKECYCSILF